ncbi:unnamed protein product [Sphenostylis stenocarpa]|uniref:Uncharacterized protein n=1 Tax=Sphenostylis stenocarpa TaxID=92480 RepID=A0AA86W663_9FABA|nr:unnamed protein product [Sphenostylis stenocarpa]
MQQEDGVNEEQTTLKYSRDVCSFTRGILHKELVDYLKKHVENAKPAKHSVENQAMWLVRTTRKVYRRTLTHTAKPDNRNRFERMNNFTCKKTRILTYVNEIPQKFTHRESHSKFSKSLRIHDFEYVLTYPSVFFPRKRGINALTTGGTHAESSVAPLRK